MRRSTQEIVKSLNADKKIPITLTVPKKLNEKLTKWCKKEGVKKSHLIEKLTSKFLSEN